MANHRVSTAKRTHPLAAGASVGNSRSGTAFRVNRGGVSSTGVANNIAMSPLVNGLS
jgi:hypothetical protein